IPKLQITKAKDGKGLEVSCVATKVKTGKDGTIPQGKEKSLDNLKEIIKLYVQEKKPVPPFLLAQIEKYNKSHIFGISKELENTARAQTILRNDNTTSKALESFVWTTKLKNISKDLGRELLEKAKRLGTVDENIMK